MSKGAWYVKRLNGKVKTFLNGIDGCVCFNFNFSDEPNMPRCCFIYKGQAYFVDCMTHQTLYKAYVARLKRRKLLPKNKAIKRLRSAGANYIQVYSLEEFIELFFKEIAKQ